jgi:hypothetical protein
MTFCGTLATERPLNSNYFRRIYLSSCCFKGIFDIKNTLVKLMLFLRFYMKKIFIFSLCVISANCNSFQKPEDVIPIDYSDAVVDNVSEKNDDSESVTQNSVEDSGASPLNEYDSAAMQMAGTNISEKFRNDRLYKDYVKFIDDEWKRLETESLSKIEEWALKNISPHTRAVDTVFYPFGGPDVAYVLKFFPMAKEYILVGLEKVGKFDDIKRSLENPDITINLKKALRSYLRGGYFITSEMSHNLCNNFLKGSLYVILFQLAKLNFRINLVEELCIDMDGNVVQRGKDMLDCVRITFTGRNDSSLKYIYYVRANLDNRNKLLHGLKKFVKKSPFCTFLKSASYALHDRTLSEFKKFILCNTQCVLQDDSGLPFDDFFDKEWNKYVFGTYLEPTLPIFKIYKQNSLVEFYQKANVVEIPFKIGYGYNQKRPNLILAVPKIDRMPENKLIIEEVRNIKKCADSECKSCNE